MFAAITSLAFVSVAAVPHASSLTADDGPVSTTSAVDTQALVAPHEEAADVRRDDYRVTEPPPPPPPPPPPAQVSRAPVSGTPDPGTAQAIAHSLVTQRGWGQGEFDCLVALWNRESGWNVYAHNPSSGAYGIPQALPGNKMASVGPDWQTNPRTQILWGLGYIGGRYGSPCGAWAASESQGWY